AVPLRAAWVDRAPENGLRRSAGQLAARSAQRLGGIPARRKALEARRILRSRTDSAALERAHLRPAQLAASPLGRPHVSSVGRSLARDAGRCMMRRERYLAR